LFVEAGRINVSGLFNCYALYSNQLQVFVEKKKIFRSFFESKSSFLRTRNQTNLIAESISL